jgi:hypothetical protein
VGIVKSLYRVAAVVTALMALAVAALAGVGAPAGAQEYGAVCSVAAEYDDATGVLRVVGTGLEPGFTTPVVLDGETIGEATADGLGNFDVEIAIQLDAIEGLVGISCNAFGDQASTTVTGSVADLVVLIIDPPTIDCAGNLRGFVEGARPGTDVSFTLDSTGEVIAVVEADADGRAAYAVVVDVEPGSYTVTSTGEDGLGDAFSITEPFTAPSGCDGGGGGGGDGGGDDLVRTGTDSVPLALAGVAAVGVGSVVLFISRRRRFDSA